MVVSSLSLRVPMDRLFDMCRGLAERPPATQQSQYTAAQKELLKKLGEACAEGTNVASEKGDREVAVALFPAVSMLQSLT